jgi:sigma-B regulation protein RsbU (phosphoserine phosphatase)
VKAPGTAARILVVDDEARMLRTVERVLAPLYEVSAALSPGAALDALPAFHPDLAILDLRMPEMDGFELLAALKRARPDLDVILMTASVDDLDAELVRALRAGAFYFIQKPFDREVLRALVARCLALRRATEANRLHLRQLEEELAAARVFQQSLLPPPAARLGELTVAARSLSSAALGGDLYDYAPAGPGRAALLVADVTGHGVAAAMLTGIVKSAFAAARSAEYAPVAVVTQIASALRPFSHERFVTAIAVRVSLDPPRLEYVNAGHPPGIVAGEGSPPRLLESTGALISPALRGLTWQAETVPFGRGDRVLLVTDGITEAAGDKGYLGLEPVIERMAERVPAAEAADLGWLLDDVLALADAFTGGRPADDDRTLLAARLDAPDR